MSSAFLSIYVNFYVLVHLLIMKTKNKKLLRQQLICLIKLLTSQDEKNDKVHIVGFCVMHCTPDPNVEGLITTIALVSCSQKVCHLIHSVHL